MKDNNNLIVYCEFEDGNISDVSLELLTKGRSLATQLGVKLEAVVLGDKLEGVEKFSHMALTVYINLKTKSCILTHRCHMPRH